MKEAHLIFFDAKCKLCQRAVLSIFERDRSRKFLFAPLEGKTADLLLIGVNEHLKKANTLVLMEHFQKKRKKTWVRAKAIFRIFWILGGVYKLIGALFFVPISLDPLYKLVARHRHRLIKKVSPLPSAFKERLLP